MKSFPPPRDLRSKQYLMLAVILVVGGVWLAIGASNDGGNDEADPVVTTTVATASDPAAAPGVTTIPDLVGEEEVPDDCTIPTKTLRSGDTGAAVTCVQKALVRTEIGRAHV